MMDSKRINIVILSLLVLILLLTAFLVGCREYDGKMDIAYFFKTEPEKTVIDFLECLNQKDAEYIYSNLLLSSEKSSVSRERYVEEFGEILKEVEKIKTRKTVYLGYEKEMSKVVAEFDITYNSGDIKQYKKYFYLIEEAGKWKIILEKTFI